MDSSKFNRRIFLKNTVVGIGGASLLISCKGAISPWRFFSKTEAKLVIAICEQIIPADDDPGATDANVINFIDKQLVGPYMRFQKMYRNGLESTQQTCVQLYQSMFQDLSWQRQTEVLQGMESGEVPADLWPDPTSPSFFNMIRQHTMQGFYGSPRHGGNPNYMSYRMLKLDYPQIIGQNRYK